MFKNAINLFEIFGFKVRVDPSWLLIAALIVWSLSSAYFPANLPGHSHYDYIALAIVAMLGLFASLILHELAHALVARQFGLQIGGITLFIFGGVAELEQEPRNPKSEFWIAIAGPAMSFALSGLAFWMLHALDISGVSPSLHEVVAYLGLINLILALFNLVPAFPLDGGRVLRAALWWMRDDLLWATRIASNLGTGFGALLIVSGVLSLFTVNSVGGLWQILIGFFVINASTGSYRQLEIKMALKDQTVQSLMAKSPRTADVDDDVATLVDEIMLARNVSFIPVLEGEHLLGYVDTSLIHAIDRENWSTARLGDILVPVSDENTVPADMPMDVLFEKMVRSGRRKMLVGQGGRLDGVIALADLVSYLAICNGLGLSGKRDRLPGRQPDLDTP